MKSYLYIYYTFLHTMIIMYHPLSTAWVTRVTWFAGTRLKSLSLDMTCQATKIMTLRSML